MNAQLPPTDPMLREQLARRSAGRMPEKLLAETYARLEASPQAVRRAAPSPIRLPRPVWAIAGVTAAALIGLAVALPVFRPAPTGNVAGYPAQRALSTAELAELMAGPELAANTTIVASVTIVENFEVCPMNSRPTVGVVEGMRSQVCVMGSSLADRLSAPTATGVFAFRYMAPGYLSLVGEVTPASSRLAFRVTEDWPLAGRAFLVEGYLGATTPFCAFSLPSAGLNPTSDEPCWQSWLSEDGSASAVQSFATWSPGATLSPEPSADVLLALDGKARHVQAGIVRQLDSVPLATTHGVYVVQAVTGPCPWSAPYDSRGCATWHVLAAVPELSLPGPDYTPTPTPSPTTPPLVQPNGLLGPGNEPLTLTQVVDLMQADPDHLAGWTVVMDAPFGSGVACPDEPGSQCGALKDLRQSQGTWAVRIQSDGLFGIMGEVRKSGSGLLVSPLPEAATATDGYLRVVDAWLHAVTASACATAQPTQGTTDCHTIEIAWLTPDGTDLSATRASVQTGAYDAFIGGTDRSPAHGIYLLSPNLLLSRFAPEGWKPGHSASPPASPQSIGYPARRALTPDELHQVLLSPGLAAGTTLVATMTITVRHEGCAIGGYLQAGVANIGPWSYCVVVATEADYLQKDVGWGLFAFQYLAPNYLLLYGSVTPASSTGKIALEPDAAWPSEGVILVEGRMTPYAAGACPVLGAGCRYSILQKEGASPAPSPWPYATGPVPGLGRMVTTADLGPDTESGVFVLTRAPSCWQSVVCAEWTVLARIDESVAKGLPVPTLQPPQTPSTLKMAGLVGAGGRPLTQAEFSNAWMHDPDHLSNRVALVKGPVPAGFVCWNGGVSDSSAPPGLCQLGVEPSQIAPEGYWAVQVGADGKLKVLGELTMNGSLFVWSVDQVIASKSLQQNDLLLVQAALWPTTSGSCPADNPVVECHYYAALASTVSGKTVSLRAMNGYLGLTGGMRPVDGLFLIQRGAANPTILAGFEVAYLDD